MESIKFAAPVDNNNKEWNKKKNYGPAVLFTVLLLGTAFLAGKSYGRNSNDPTSSVSPIASLSVPEYAAGGLLLQRDDVGDDIVCSPCEDESPCCSDGGAWDIWCPGCGAFGSENIKASGSF